MLREAVPGSADAAFGVGLYDYYADVLLALREGAALPGRPARRRSRARPRADRVRRRGVALPRRRGAGAALRDLRVLRGQARPRAGRGARHAPAPSRLAAVGAASLAEHLRDRMGLYAESARVGARAARDRRNAAIPTTRARRSLQARVSLGETLLLDLRFADARRELLAVKDGGPELRARRRARAPPAGALPGERGRPRGRGRPTTAAPRRRPIARCAAQAEAALRTPLSARRGGGPVAGRPGAPPARSGRQREAAEVYRRASRAWPASREAALLAAEDEILHGEPERRARRGGGGARGGTSRSRPGCGPGRRCWRASCSTLAGERAPRCHGIQESIGHDRWGATTCGSAPRTACAGRFARAVRL